MVWCSRSRTHEATTTAQNTTKQFEPKKHITCAVLPSKKNACKLFFVFFFFFFCSEYVRWLGVFFAWNSHASTDHHWQVRLESEPNRSHVVHTLENSKMWMAVNKQTNNPNRMQKACYELSAYVHHHGWKNSARQVEFFFEPKIETKLISHL